jgi:hypothetical protein
MAARVQRINAAGIEVVGPPSHRFPGPGGPFLSSFQSGNVVGTASGRRRSLAAGTAIFIGAFLYVLPEAADLVDDHFMHVAWGRQLLYGRWPVRDMVVLGLPLQYALSAAFEWVFGYRLLSEGLLVALAFATGALLTFVLARRASGSTSIGILAALFQVAVAPRTYSYPKIVLYAAAILALWMYVDRPSRRRLVLLGAIVGVGFYLRHDHGLYLGVVAAGMVMLRHAADPAIGARRLVTLAAVCAFAIAPYLVYAQFQVGVVSYVNDIRAIAEREHQQNRFEGWPRWPLSSVDDVIEWPGDPPSATIGVRWTASSQDDARRAAARRYGLQAEHDRPVESGRYLLTDITNANVRALISDPVIDDTSGVDRRTGIVPLQGLRLGSLHLLSGLDAPRASAAFLFYVLVALLATTLVILAATPHRDATTRLEHVKIAAAVLVGLLTALGFLREPLTIRIADAVVAPAILIAWWAGKVLRSTHSRRRYLIAVAAIVLLIPTIRSTVVIGAVPSRVARLRHLPAVWQQLSVSPPFEKWQPGTAKHQAVRYVRACTAPEEPLLVLWFAPDLYYYSDRPFAGRLGFYLEGYWTSVDHERANIAALERDRPVIVLMEPGRTATDLYTYPQLLDYVAAYYHPLGELHSGDGRRVRVHARNDRRPSGVDVETGWPCYANAAGNLRHSMTADGD